MIRFDAGTVPVGYVVFSSESRTVDEIQDLALNRVRPAFATLPGLTSPPPFGGNQRTVVVTVNPGRLRAYSMSPDEVAQAINSGNVLQPAGNVRMGSLLRIAESDSVTPNLFQGRFVKSTGQSPEFTRRYLFPFQPWQAISNAHLLSGSRITGPKG